MIAWPTYYYFDPWVAEIQKAWRDHYLTKGCSKRKAEALSCKKYKTMPPGFAFSKERKP